MLHIPQTHQQPEFDQQKIGFIKNSYGLCIK